MLNWHKPTDKPTEGETILIKTAHGEYVQGRAYKHYYEIDVYDGNLLTVYEGDITRWCYTKDLDTEG